MALVASSQTRWMRSRSPGESDGGCAPRWIGVGASAAVVDDEPDVERFGVSPRFPRLAEQARLFVGRERGRLADVHVRRAQAQDRGDDRREDVMGRDTSRRTGRSCRSASADDLGQHAPLGRRRRGIAQVVGADVDAEQSNGHDHDVAVARRLERGGQVRERVRVADEHEHAARADVHLVERELVGRKDVERVGFVRHGWRQRFASDASEEQNEAAHQRERRDGRGSRATTIANGAGADEERRAEEPERDLARAEVQVEGRLEGPGRRTQFRSRTSAAILSPASPRSRSHRRAPASRRVRR